MKYVLAIIGVLAALSSLGSCVLAKGAVQEAVGAAMGVVAVLGIGLAAVLEKLERIEKTIRQQAYELGQVLSKLK